jgi:hypothetical protein
MLHIRAYAIATDSAVRTLSVIAAVLSCVALAACDDVDRVDKCIQGLAKAGLERYVKPVKVLREEELPPDLRLTPDGKNLYFVDWVDVYGRTHTGNICPY